MSVLVSAKTKGIIKNNKTGAIKKFQFNPTNFSYARGASYSEITAPGQSYPITHFVAGQIKVFDLKLYFYDRDKSRGVIKGFIDFFNDLLTPEVNIQGYKRPPDFTFIYGYFIRKCVLDNLDFNIIDLDENGEPIEAEITLTIRQVSP